MKNKLSVKMLAAFALVLLVSSGSEGRIVGKCELKAQLQAALGGNSGGSGNVSPGPRIVAPGLQSVVIVPEIVPPGPGIVSPAPENSTGAPGNATEGVPGNVTASVTVPGNVSASVTVPVSVTVPKNSTADLNLIARIVCSVDRVSKFNTALVSTIQGAFKPPPPPPAKPAQRPWDKPGKPGKPGRGRRSPKHDRHRRSKGSDSSESSESSEERPSLTTTLFGIFQLSNRLACDSGAGQTLNLCRINCSALIDDDISDDIACLKTLLDSANNVTALALSSVHKKKHFWFEDKCRNVNPAQYFSECI